MKTNDRPLTDLMKAVDTGAAQLPDFQRGWVWDDGRIKALILSVIHNFPVGAAMFLEYGNDSIHFKYKPIEGSNADSFRGRRTTDTRTAGGNDPPLPA